MVRASLQSSFIQLHIIPDRSKKKSSAHYRDAQAGTFKVAVCFSG
jgi:hypothetical protein